MWPVLLLRKLYSFCATDKRFQLFLSSIVLARRWMGKLWVSLMKKFVRGSFIFRNNFVTVCVIQLTNARHTRLVYRRYE